MVGDRVGAGEDAAGLAVEAFAVGEEYGAFARVLFADLAALADEALRDDCAAGDLGAFGDDEIFGLHVAADSCGGFGAAEYGSVFKQRGPIDDGRLSHLDVDDALRVAEPCSGADLPVGPSGSIHLTSREIEQLFGEPRAVAVQAEQVGELAVEPVEQHDLSSAALVEHFDFHAVSEGCPLAGFHGAYVFDAGPVADVVAGDVDADSGNADVFADRACVDRCTFDSAGLLDSRLVGNCSSVGAQLNNASETDVSHPLRQEALCHLDEAPIG